MQFGYFSALHDPDLAIGFSGVLEDFLAELDFVEELGFEGVWTGEHHLGPEGFSNGPNPVLLSAYIASRTGLASIGLACVTATIWHPIRLAEDLAMLDHNGDPRAVRLRRPAEVRARRLRRVGARQCPPPPRVGRGW